ncbi:MAG: protein kinase domain-containing protein [Planctomycetota bacterium]|jgi:serine/threonine protein kinase
MKGNDANATFIYQTDQVPVHRWRQVMEICQAYEKCLLDGQTTPAEDFAFQYPSVPKDLLLPELERVRGECIEEATTPSQIEPFEYPQSDRYQILDEIRSGGMGQVFRAFDRACGRLVALKKIRKEFAQDTRARRRFLAEVELTADLEHPGVIPIYDQSVDSTGREFYVMRLICGDGSGTLQQAIERFHSQSDSDFSSRKRFWNSSKRGAFRKLVESVLAIVETTAHAHSRGIAHRDLKPANILVGPYGETLIADWGLAKRINSPGQQLSNLVAIASSDKPMSHSESTWASTAPGVGTPGFRAPETESATKSPNLIAADIYSLGAILDCVITGTPSRSQDNSENQSLPQIPTAAVAPLLAIAQKAMANDVADRYQSAQLLGLDIRNWLAGEPVSAYPESTAERIWKWPTRHRLLATAMASGLLITLLASGLFSWMQLAQKAELQKLLATTSTLLEENQKAKKSVEEAFSQRESLALHAIIEFQSLLTMNPSLQADSQFRSVREKVLQESRTFYENLAKSVDESLDLDQRSLDKLSDAALALILLENELGNYSDSLQVAQSACERLEKVVTPSDRLRYQLGRILAFKGNIATRNGWKAQGALDQDKAIGYLEPLIDSPELSQEDRRKAVSLWSRAASPMSIGMASKGEFQQATELLQRILSRLENLQTEDFQEELLKIQSYGNLAMVRYFAKDKDGAYGAIEKADGSVKRCQAMLHESVPFREIIEFEIMRSTLARFQSDLMLMDGKTAPALELQGQTLENLTTAARRYPSNADIHMAYHSCCSRLQTVLRENGRVSEARRVVDNWVRLALELFQEDHSNPKTGEFLMHAHHSLGHFSEATNEFVQAQESYQSALAVANRMIQSTQATANVLSQAMELHVHLIKFELKANRNDTAEEHFQQAIGHALELKALPSPNEGSLLSIKQQMENALRFAQELGNQELKDAWSKKIAHEGLLPAS